MQIFYSLSKENKFHFLFSTFLYSIGIRKQNSIFYANRNPKFTFLALIPLTLGIRIPNVRKIEDIKRFWIPYP